MLLVILLLRSRVEGKVSQLQLNATVKPAAATPYIPDKLLWAQCDSFHKSAYKNEGIPLLFRSLEDPTGYMQLESARIWVSEQGKIC